jgi:hypothetical protein
MMKMKLLGLLACIVLLGASPASATTYEISATYAPALTGTITTDGNTGVLSTNDILSWNLTINNGNTNDCAIYGSCNFIDVLTSTNSQVLVDGEDLVGTATTLSFDYADTAPGVPFCCDSAAGRLAFFTSNASVQFISVGYVPGNPTGGFELQVNVPVVDLGAPELGFPIIAGTPLPAALPLFATGLGVISVFGWRRKQKGDAIAIT